MFFCYETYIEISRKSTITWKKWSRKKFIFSTELKGGMFFCYETYSEVSRKSKNNKKKNIDKQNLFFRPSYWAECFSEMKLTVRLVGRVQLINLNDWETKLIFSTGLMGGMFFCYESDSEVSRKSTIAWTKWSRKKFIFTTGLIGGMFFCYESDREVSRNSTIT